MNGPSQELRPAAGTDFRLSERASSPDRRVTEEARVVFFWDYDTQWGADRSRSAGGPKSWGPLEFENTDRLLELHEEFGVAACFAVVGAAALPGARPYHDPDQIRLIAKAGHEIGSHAFRHEWLPGLSAADLRESLRASKDALEQCIGETVVTFVPPYNQPFDYPAGWSFSRSERREVKGHRNDLGRLCEALHETGYRVSRVSFRSLARRLVERLAGRRIDRPEKPRSIAGMLCLNLNSPGGFDRPALEGLDRCVRDGGVLVVYGHPHSLRLGDTQDEKHLVPFLRRLTELRRAGLLRVCLPREFLGEREARRTAG